MMIVTLGAVALWSVMAEQGADTYEGYYNAGFQNQHYINSADAPQPRMTPAPQAEVSASSANASPGEYVDVAIRMDRNLGISLLDLNISYNSAVLTRVDISDVGLIPIPQLPPTDANPFRLNFAVAASFEYTNNDGLLATVRFRVNNDAVLGASPIEVSVVSAYQGNAQNSTYNAVWIWAINGVVTVVGGAETPSPTPSPTPPALGTVTVTFDPGQGGSFNQGDLSSFSGTVGFTVPAFPTPVRPGFVFSGWTLNGAPITAPLSVEQNINLVATWVPEAQVTPSPTPSPTPPSPGTVTATFDPGQGGSFNQGVLSSFSGTAGFTVPTFPTPVRPGFVFGGWTLNGAPVTAPLAITQNISLVATWVPAVQVTPSPTPSPTPPSPGTVTVTFNPGQGGSFNQGVLSSFTGAAGFTVPTFPTPVRPGFVFSGWTLNGAPATAPLSIAQNISLIATWVPAAQATPSPTPQPTPSPSPTPTPSPSSRPNPQTNPLQIGFTIFGGVIFLGLAGFGIISITKKHIAETKVHNSEVTRQNREDRITDLMSDEKKIGFVEHNGYNIPL